MMSKKKVDLSIIIPAYKEEELLEDTLRRTNDYITTELNGINVELIVVSADPPGEENKTAHIASSFKARSADYKVILPGKKVGKGRDVQEGMLASSGNIRLFMDADLATPLSYIKEFYYQIKEQNYDLVLGVRDIEKMHNSKIRKFSSQLANKAISLLAVNNIKDTQCGFKAFSAPAAQQLFEPLFTEGWGFDIEILRRAQLLGMKINKVRIQDWHDPKSVGLAFENPLKAQLRTLRELINIRLRLK